MKEKKEQIAFIAILVNVFLTVGKLIAGFMVGSGAIVADGLHSGMDIVASAVSFIGIKISKKPVDKKHPYGHYKFEVMAGLVITVILFVTGGFIVVEAVEQFKDPIPVSLSYLAFGVMLFSIIGSEIMARIKIAYGKKENSVSLLSDGVHSRVDVYTSIAIIIGLFVAPYWIYIDSVLMLLIGVYIIKESFPLGKEAIDSLLDISADDEIEDEIKSIAQTHNIEVNALKTQKKGPAITAHFEIHLSSDLHVSEATEISRHLRKDLIEKIDTLEYVSIQICSHNVETEFFKPEIGKGFGWQTRSDV